MTQQEYGTTIDGTKITQFTLQNKSGLVVSCINYGCRITNMLVPGPSGVADIALGFDDFASYEKDTSSQGAFVGRYANRIKGAQFQLDGQTYQLLQNNGQNYLHGNFSKQVFSAEVLGENMVRFCYTSPDGEDGFPGEVKVTVTYTLTDENEWIMDYRAVPTAPTHINLTNHCYFNLAGSGNVLQHVVKINSNSILEADETLCPTGRTVDITGGAFDFTQEKCIGQDIEKQDPLLLLAGGYDHCYILNKPLPGELTWAASASNQGRTLHVYTTQPAMQFYTGNFLTGQAGKGGVPMEKRTGFCLETQHYPNTPNSPAFPPTLVQAGETHHQITVLQLEW